jgi:Sulfotransferase family
VSGAKFLNGLGPRINSAAGLGFPAGWTLRTTGTDPVAKAIAGSGAEPATIGPDVPLASQGVMSNDFVWLAANHVEVMNAMRAGTVVRLFTWVLRGDRLPAPGDVGQIVAVGDTSGGWRVGFADVTGAVLARGEALFRAGDVVTLLFESRFRAQDGIRLWANGKLALDFSRLAARSYVGQTGIRVGGATASVGLAFGRIVLCSGQADDMRPDPSSIAVQVSTPNSNGEVRDSGSETSCVDGSGGYVKWRDWAAGGLTNDDASYNCFPGGTAGQGETSGFSSVKFAVADNPPARSVTVQLWLRAESSDVLVQGEAVLRAPGGPEACVLLPAPIPTTYTLHTAQFDLSPDDDEWKSSDFATDATQMGFRRIDARSVAVRVSAIGAVVYGWNELPAGLTRVTIRTAAVRACPNPVFVIGSPRSGTSILPWSLAYHPDFWTSDETEFILGLFGEGRANAVYSTLSRKPRSFIAQQGVDRKEFFGSLGLGINALVSSRSKSRRWVDQSPGYTTIASLLADMFPGAYFLHMLRDGRAVVNSMLHFGDREDGLADSTPLPAWATDFEAAAETWRYFVEQALDFCARNPDRALTVRNEDLVERTEEEFKTIFAFLGSWYDPAPASFFQASRVNSSFEPVVWGVGRRAARLSKASLRARTTDAWRSWSAEQRATFTGIAGDLLQRLGYPPEIEDSE